MRKNYIERRFLDLQNLKKLADAPDFNLVKNLGHQLKGNAKSFGFDDLTSVAIAFEKTAERQDKISFLSAVADFEKYLILYAQRLASEEAISNQ